MGPSVYIISCERGQSSDRIFARGCLNMETHTTLTKLTHYVIRTLINIEQNY